MTTKESIQQIVNSTPNNPVKIFEALQLPIIYIDDVDLLKNAKGRSFQYKGKTLFSPEIVAVTYYQSHGHIASWNEGVAFSMVRDALQLALNKNIYDFFEYIGIKDEARLASPRYSSKEKRAITRMEVIENENSEFLEIQRPRLDQLEIDHQKEKSIIESRDGILIAGAAIFNREVEWIKFLVDSLVSLRCRCSPEELMEIFKEIFKKLMNNKSLIIDELRLPASKPEMKDHRSKFYNQWTMQFAKQMVIECDLDYLSRELYMFSQFSPCWDLTLIDGVTKKIRYIEVKMNDNFTEYQKLELPIHLQDGGNLELCIVRPRQAVNEMEVT